VAARGRGLRRSSAERLAKAEPRLRRYRAGMRIGTGATTVVSVALALVGAVIVVFAGSTEVAYFGWLIVAIGLLFALVNLLLRERMPP
jgi:Flp pilus assembly protein TadB